LPNFYQPIDFRNGFAKFRISAELSFADQLAKRQTVNQSLPPPCVLGLAASHHWNYRAAPYHLYSLQR
jgi:hypothetical protein